MRVSIVAAGAGCASPASFVYDLLVCTISGTSTIVAGPTLGFSYNPLSLHTVSITVSGNALQISFTSGVSTVRAVATIEATELVFV